LSVEKEEERKKERNKKKKRNGKIIYIGIPGKNRRMKRRR